MQHGSASHIASDIIPVGSIRREQNAPFIFISKTGNVVRAIKKKRIEQDFRIMKYNLIPAGRGGGGQLSLDKGVEDTTARGKLSCTCPTDRS